jgi:hypothetical protein
MNANAFNPQARPVQGATRPGGLFINWRGNWQGNLATAAANTNIQSSGLSDQESGSNSRHDPAVDIVYLVNLYAYQAANRGDSTFAADAARMQPIVKQEYANVGYYRCWLYFQLRDLATLQPSQGWGGIADRYAAGVYRRYYNTQAGTITDPRHSGIYRTDFAAECAAMLIDAGNRQHKVAWTEAGNSTLAHLIRRAQDPKTHLFPLQMKLGGAKDTVVQAQLKVGEEAQLLNAFLDAYDLTGNKSYLEAVTQAVNSLYSPSLGLWDQVHGGFFFSVDADGNHLETGYKESRQGWMLPLLRHLARIQSGGEWAARQQEMLTVVRDKLWQPSIHGYPYRETPSFVLYQSGHGPGHTHVVEDWVTSEAMGIACESLESQLLPSTQLPRGMNLARSGHGLQRPGDARRGGPQSAAEARRVHADRRRRDRHGAGESRAAPEGGHRHAHVAQPGFLAFHRDPLAAGSLDLHPQHRGRRDRVPGDGREAAAEHLLQQGRGEKARIALPVAVQYSGSRPATRDSCFSPRCPMIFSTYITSRPSWICHQSTDRSS